MKKIDFDRSYVPQQRIASGISVGPGGGGPNWGREGWRVGNPRGAVADPGDAFGVGSYTELRSVGDPEQALANTSKRDYQTYRGTYQGLIDDLLEMSESTDIIDSTAQRLDGLGERRSGMQNRNDSRTLATMTPAQRLALQKRNKFNTAQESTATMNNARIDQRTVNQNRRQELIATAMGASQSASEGMGQAAGMAANRDMQYKNAKAQYKNQRIGTGAALAALAFMI